MEYRFREARHQTVASRGPWFEDVIGAIDEHGLLMKHDNPDQRKCPRQRIIVARTTDAPDGSLFAFAGDVVDPRAVYPSRRFRHLLERVP